MPITNIRTYSFSDRDNLFFDANIWFYLYGPQSQKYVSRQRDYSSAFQSIISHRSKIYIDVLILSEFINRVARFYYDLWCINNQSEITFKDYRNMKDFKPIAQEIQEDANLILVETKTIETGFNHMDSKSILAKFGNSQNDFNDLIIEAICRTNKFILITDDSDFLNSEISILTYNQQLIMKAKN